MEIKRKIQIGAAAVLANALVALFAMSPGPAMANPCSPTGICSSAFGWNVCPSAADQLAICNSIAAAGCTATSAQCIPVAPGCGGFISCRYD